MDFDFIVVGAGPIGSYLSGLLARDGFSVAIFDRKQDVGKGVVCSGIIGKGPYHEFDLPEDAIIGKISTGLLFSPSLIEFQYSHGSPFAYIADREKLDKILFARAVNEGVSPFLGNIVTDLKKEKERILLKYLRNGGIEEKSARCVIIATGHNFALHRKAKLVAPERFLWGSRVELDYKMEGPLEIYFLNNPDIGSFGWVIPFGDKTRMGILSKDYDRNALYSLIQKTNGRFKFREDRVEDAPIAYGDSKKMVDERVIAVGEAAGQVKTTTGGGIHYGLIGASIAHNTLKKAALADDFSANNLLEYERLWRIRMGEQVKAGITLRNLLSKMPPKAIDLVFNWAKKNPAIKEKLEQSFCFDYHKDLIEFGINLMSGKNNLKVI